MRISKNAKLGLNLGLAFAAAFAMTSLLSQKDATANATAANVRGTQAIYGNIPPDQIETIATGDRIKSAAASGSMMAIWETLEHGEKVECLDCIPSVAPLMYDNNPRTREIAAWWLRRRIFGVFGPGEVYQKTVETLATDPNPTRRAYAAEALGEFLARPGVVACARAIETDADPNVRAAAARALGRLNDDGTGALARAMTDADARVKLAAIGSASRINGFSDVPSVARLVTDGDAKVRRNSAELLGAMRAKDSVDALMSIAKNDADAGVRNAACHSLGALHEGRARAVLEDIAANDTDGLVRDQAKIALRRL